MLSQNQANLCNRILSGEQFGAVKLDLSWQIVMECGLTPDNVAEIKAMRIRNERPSKIARLYNVSKKRLRWLLKTEGNSLPEVSVSLRDALQSALNGRPILNSRHMTRVLAHLDFLVSAGPLSLPVNHGSVHSGWYPVAGKLIHFRSKLEAKLAAYYQRLKETGVCVAWEYKPQPGFNFDGGLRWSPDFHCHLRSGERENEFYTSVCSSPPENWLQIKSAMERDFWPGAATLATSTWFKENEEMLNQSWDPSLWQKQRMIV